MIYLSDEIRTPYFLSEIFKIMPMKKHLVFLPSIVFLISCGNGNEKNEKENTDSTAEKKSEQSLSPEDMEIKEMKERAEKGKEMPIENPYKNAKIEVKVINNETSKENKHTGGFGYDIFLFDAMYVHQPHVPAINGNRGFKTKEQAKTAGELVAYKIRNNIMPPSISVEELDSMGVLK